jgi:hypothetical protein
MHLNTQYPFDHVLRLCKLRVRLKHNCEAVMKTYLILNYFAVTDFCVLDFEINFSAPYCTLVLTSLGDGPTGQTERVPTHSRQVC